MLPLFVSFPLALSTFHYTKRLTSQCWNKGLTRRPPLSTQVTQRQKKGRTKVWDRIRKWNRLILLQVPVR
jgi:hypothetical protein